LGLAAIQKARVRQKSRLTWLRQGDANTKFFHIMVNARKKKNLIHSLQSGNGIAISQIEKHKLIYDHFL
jgi:hypothetical protein